MTFLELGKNMLPLEASKSLDKEFAKSKLENVLFSANAGNGASGCISRLPAPPNPIHRIDGLGDAVDLVDRPAPLGMENLLLWRQALLAGVLLPVLDLDQEIVSGDSYNQIRKSVAGFAGIRHAAADRL